MKTKQKLETYAVVAVQPRYVRVAITAESYEEALSIANRGIDDGLFEKGAFADNGPFRLVSITSPDGNRTYF